MSKAMKPTQRVLRIVFSFTLAVIIAVAGGCDSVLQKEPLDRISSGVVWSDPALVDAYLFDAYDQMSMQQGYGFNSFMSWTDDALAADMVTGAAWQYLNHAAVSIPDGGGAHWSMQHWAYENIRRANTIIEELPKTELGQDFTDQRVAEARFIRAREYFEMVKRYGGVPLITKAQPLDAPEDSIFVVRASEQRIYDFIGNEVDAIVDDLPELDNGIEGRATRYAALALKSRAMLYAASVAQFGEVQLNGLLGVSASDADRYWQEAYDASVEILDNGPYTLFEEYDDPAENYYKLFVTDIPDHPEVIFGQLFDGQDKGHSNTLQNLAMEYAAGWGANAGASYDFVEMFEFQDGSSTQIPRSEIEAREWSPEELFGNRDPRFRGAVIYPGSVFRDKEITFHKATIVDGEEVTSGTVGEDWPASSPSRNRSTGFLLRKRTRDDQQPSSHGTDNTDYIEYRLGEIYLNAAEAAFYLGKTQEALTYVNRIRQRAEMPELDHASEEAIRHEREVELNLEQHRFWDLRRWRTAEEELDGRRVQGLSYKFNWDTKKYIIDLVNLESVPRTFQKRHYYLPIGANRLADNPKLVENPGY